MSLKSAILVLVLGLAGMVALLVLAYDHYRLYQHVTALNRDREMLISNETSLTMERDQWKAITQALYAERQDLENDLNACLSHVVNADDTGNPMPGFARESQFSMVKKAN